MKILLEVFADLWNFFTFGFFKKKISLHKKDKKIDKNLNSKSENLEDNEKTVRQPISHSDAKKAQVIDLKLTPVNTNGVVCVEQARLFVRPVWTFDGAFKLLLYGTKVQIIRHEGRFTQICVNYVVGWVLKDEITAKLTDVFPFFHKDVVYAHSHGETRKLRQLTKDEFFTAELRLPLQAVEFVSYQLSQTGRSISWSDERPRLAGNWQNLLKGHLGVHIGIEPKTGSIMEYQYRDGTGHLGYVKEVHADESIVFLSVGREVDGKYTEEKFSKTKWQEYRPVFIQIS